MLQSKVYKPRNYETINVCQRILNFERNKTKPFYEQRSKMNSRQNKTFQTKQTLVMYHVLKVWLHYRFKKVKVQGNV